MRKPNIKQMSHKKLLSVYRTMITSDALFITDDSEKDKEIIEDMETEILRRMPWHEEPKARKAASEYFQAELERLHKWQEEHSNSHQ